MKTGSALQLAFAGILLISMLAVVLVIRRSQLGGEGPTVAPTIGIHPEQASLRGISATASWQGQRRYLLHRIS